CSSDIGIDKRNSVKRIRNPAGQDNPIATSIVPLQNGAIVSNRERGSSFDRRNAIQIVALGPWILPDPLRGRGSGRVVFAFTLSGYEGQCIHHCETNTQKSRCLRKLPADRKNFTIVHSNALHFISSVPSALFLPP